MSEVFFLSLENEYPVTLWPKINDQVQQYAHITGRILKHKKLLLLTNTDSQICTGEESEALLC